MHESQPNYVTFEGWVRENAAPDNLTPEAIERINNQILSTSKPEPWRSEMLDTLGLPSVYDMLVASV